MAGLGGSQIAGGPGADARRHHASLQSRGASRARRRTDRAVRRPRRARAGHCRRRLRICQLPHLLRGAPDDRVGEACRSGRGRPPGDQGAVGSGITEQGMQFGYFTLSDNHYEQNARSANAFVADILDEAVYAEKVGLHSAWIGEHHFSTLGVLSCPALVLAQVAARTSRLRLAPAVTVLPLHHPLQVAEDWATLDLLSGGRVDFAAGRGYDRAEYAAFGAPFDDSAAVFAEGLEIIWRAWHEPGRWSHEGRYYRFHDVE